MNKQRKILDLLLQFCIATNDNTAASDDELQNELTKIWKSLNKEEEYMLWRISGLLNVNCHSWENIDNIDNFEFLM